jgi:hypothetical protein
MRQYVGNTNLSGLIGKVGDAGLSLGLKRSMNFLIITDQ